MASAFERVVKSVVQELDHSRDLIPVDSLRRSVSFRPYCLLSRKPSRSWFWKARYTCVNLSIRDILEPNTPEPDVECVGPFHFQDTMDGQLQGSMALVTPGQGKLAGGAAVSGSSSASMNVCTLRVAPNAWTNMLQERRLQQPEHKVLKQLRNRGDNVFVVTEVLQTQKEVEVTRTRKQEGSGQFSMPGVWCFQGKGEGHLSLKKTVTIPSGSILAFQVAQLVIGSDCWDILLIPDKKQRTFESPQTGRKLPSGAIQTESLGFSSSSSGLHSDGLSEDWWTPTEDFQSLQAEVNAQARGLGKLSGTLCKQLRGRLGKVLLDERALEALEESLEQGLNDGQVEPLEGPVGDILECLVLPSRKLVTELAEPIDYLLGALAALNETQHQLLAEMLEVSALSESFKLVESLLEQSTPWQEPRALSLTSELLGESWGSEAPAWILLEACGLELQVSAPQVVWKPDARDHMCALYASLALLRKLS